MSLPEDVSADALELEEAFDTHDHDYTNDVSLIPEDDLMHTSISEKKSSTKPKNAANHTSREELLLVTLVHGDMLILEGDDFTVSFFLIHFLSYLIEMVSSTP